jgi:hypothetical protein
MILLGKRGRIIKGPSEGWYILVQDDTANTGGYYILTSSNPGFSGGEFLNLDEQPALEIVATGIQISPFEQK